MRQWFSFYDVYPVPLVHNSCEGHILTMADSVRETMCPFFTPYHPQENLTNLARNTTLN